MTAKARGSLDVTRSRDLGLRVMARGRDRGCILGRRRAHYQAIGSAWALACLLAFWSPWRYSRILCIYLPHPVPASLLSLFSFLPTYQLVFRHSHTFGPVCLSVTSLVFAIFASALTLLPAFPPSRVRFGADTSARLPPLPLHVHLCADTSVHPFRPLPRICLWARCLVRRPHTPPYLPHRRARRPSILYSVIYTG